MQCPSNADSLCTPATSPAKINTSTPIKCDGKCQFTYSNENTSVSIIRNGQFFLSFDLTGPSGRISRFNGVNYTPRELLVFSPSLHEYNGHKAEAETVVVCAAPGASRLLYVCSPLSKSGTSGSVDHLIAIASDRIPHANSDDVVIDEKIDLDGLYGQTLFFTYQGTGLGRRTNCDEGAHFVVYAPPRTKSILPGSLDILRKLIAPDCHLPAVHNPSVVVNVNGPGGSNIGGDIYIKCEPTGDSLETKEVAFSNINIFDPSNLVNAWDVIAGLFAAILMYVLWTGFAHALSSTLGDAKMTPLYPKVD